MYVNGHVIITRPYQKLARRVGKQKLEEEGNIQQNVAKQGLDGTLDDTVMRKYGRNKPRPWVHRLKKYFHRELHAGIYIYFLIVNLGNKFSTFLSHEAISSIHPLATICRVHVKLHGIA